MRPTRRLLATAMGGGPSGGPGRPSPPMALLPPITLYRRILRSHRKHLQPRMRLLGDEYVRAEFRAHRGVENPAHLVREKKFPSIPPHPPFFHSFFFLGGLPRFDRYPLLFGLTWGLTRECAPRVGVGKRYRLVFLPSGSSTRRRSRAIPGWARSWTSRRSRR